MLKKLTSGLLLTALVLGASMNVQSDPAPDNGLVTICYYGVTMKVSQKIANRYYKIGAEPGACGESTPKPQTPFPF
ncbi:hypothetical protein [Persicitalea jodogahamensis]|uniref:Uncharacterized protein n=1 Tax=Persicitalea jodogahamensis TaxID=402147 RepID=A0A8J3D983_9BACT|nr:hypothetical protein [Persicitalea jodogahamensis]GHB63842.1 hypothetical protein GCM10007390_17090 [Persicitalea jodogahamensis]